MIDRRPWRLGAAALAAGLLAVLAVPMPSQAKFSVSPTVIDISRPPGGAAAGAFTVRLDGERGRRFAVEVEDVRQDADGAFTFSAPGASAFSASRWISVSPRAFRGRPDRNQPVEFRVQVPAYAEPGDHVTSLTVKRTAEGRGTGALPVVQALAVRVTVRVRGMLDPDAELRGLKVAGAAGGGPVTGTVMVVNTGNTRLNFDGADDGALAVVGDSRPRFSVPFAGVLYPREARRFRLSWMDPPALGRFRMRASVQTGAGIVSAAEAFWIVPWRQTVAVLLVAVAGLVFAAGRRRKRPRA